MDHQSGKIRTESHSGVFVRGLRIPPREMAQTRILSYTSSQNMFLTARCLMSLIGLLASTEKLSIGTTSHEAPSVSHQGALEISRTKTVLVATDNSTVVAYINRQGGTHSAEICALLWRIMTWYHHFHITLKARHIPGCLNVMADLLSGLNQVQSMEWSLHPQVFKQICQRWFTPHVDLFTTHLNHKLPLYVSPIPDPKAWDIDARNITGRFSLPMLPLQRLSFTR